jgi:hypothetical protein
VRGDILVLNLDSFFEFHAFEDLCGVRAARDGGTTAKSLKDCFVDCACGFIDLNLEFHYIAARRRTNESCAHINLFLIERADIARILIVVQHILVIGKGSNWHLHKR